MTGYRPPEGLVFTPAMRATSDAGLDDLHTDGPRHRALTGQWEREARLRVFGPLDAWLKHGRTT